MSFKINGLDDFSKRLQELQRNAEELDGTHSVTLETLFPDFFMLKNTNFATITEMFEKSGFSFEGQEEFEALPEDQLDEFVQKNTRFATWTEMKQTAGAEWVQKKLGFDAGDDE